MRYNKYLKPTAVPLPRLDVESRRAVELLALKLKRTKKTGLKASFNFIEKLSIPAHDKVPLFFG